MVFKDLNPLTSNALMPETGDILRTGTLTHGGIMVNYRCNAACRHCLYSCSPTRRQGYVNGESAQKICSLLCRGGCRSVHIGGGEPFLNFESLLMMIKNLNEADINIEYIETNAYWAYEASAPERLKRLLAAGADALCISIDPFHAEYIPYGAPLTLAALCEKTGIDYFLWKREFLPVLSQLDPEKNHSRQEMEKSFSGEYIYSTAKLYGIEFGGRAINIENEFNALRSEEQRSEGQHSEGMHPAEHFADSAPCRNLLSTGHFHVDMDCCFIPPRCTGIRIPLSEAINGIPEGKYPVFNALYNGGVSALLDIAGQNGYIPENAGYPSKCGLCFQLRNFLSDKGFAELDRNHYEEALRYYTFT
jgi:hypothetical protein